MLKIFRWIKRIVVALIGLVLLYQAWVFGWVVYWEDHNPKMTRFMEIRLNELRDKNPKAELKKEWVAYDRISIHLKRALITAGMASRKPSSVTSKRARLSLAAQPFPSNWRKTFSSPRPEVPGARQKRH